MDTDNTQDGAEPSPASAGSRNMAMARLSAANTWLQEEIARLRLTDTEREAIRFAAVFYDQGGRAADAATLRDLLERLN